MPKRLHSDFAGDSPAGVTNSSSKKHARRNWTPSQASESPSTRSGASLASILQHADELIECLQLLKGNGSTTLPGQDNYHRSPNAPAEEKLAKLSATLLPAFKELAGEAAMDGSQNRAPVWEKLAPEPGKSPAPTQISRQTPQGPISSVVKIPSLFSTTAWELSEISSSWPPLPPILKPELEAAALTHAGTVGMGETHKSYERLEWLGDCYLEMFASGFIFQTFGGHSAGKLTQLRELLVRNVTLASYSEKYGLPQRATLPVEFKGGIMPPGIAPAKRSEVTKVHGDIFEAYVAAIIVSDPDNGLSRTGDWLKALWGQTIEKQIRESKRKPHIGQVPELGQFTEEAKELKIPAKVRLANALVVRGVELIYEDKDSGPKKDRDHKLPLFTVAVYLKGWGEEKKFLGVGSAFGKKEAGEKAAQQALGNNKLMQTYSEKKKAYLAAREAGAMAD